MTAINARLLLSLFSLKTALVVSDEPQTQQVRRRENEAGNDVVVSFLDDWASAVEYDALWSVFTALDVPLEDWFPFGFRDPSQDDYCNFTGYVLTFAS